MTAADNATDRRTRRPRRLAVGTFGQGARLTGLVCLLAAALWLIAGNTSQSRTAAGCGITAWMLGVCCLWLARRT